MGRSVTTGVRWRCGREDWVDDALSLHWLASVWLRRGETGHGHLFSGGAEQAEILAEGWPARRRRRHSSRPIRFKVIPDGSRMPNRTSAVYTHTCVLSGFEPTRRMRTIMYTPPGGRSSSRRDPYVAMMYQVVSLSCFCSRIL